MQKLTLTAHLQELRKCLIICCLAIGIAFIPSYIYSEEIFDLLARPLYRFLPPGGSIVFTGYAEAFFLYLKLAFFAAVAVASPIILHQLWVFVAPGLYENEKKLVVPFILLSSMFFIAGVSFAYFVVFPTTFKFFLSYNSDSVTALPFMQEYFSFASHLLLAFGVAFEFPVVMCFLAKIHVVSTWYLRRNRKYAILLIFIAAAVLTPTPDAVNQLLMAGPLMLLYELSIFLIWLMERKIPDPEG